MNTDNDADDHHTIVARASRSRRIAARLQSAFHTVSNHTLRHTGVGIVCAVAYFDP